MGGWVRSQSVWGKFGLTGLGISHGATLIALECVGSCGKNGAGVHAGEKTDWGVLGEEEGKRYGEY